MSYSRGRLPFAKTGNNSKIWIIALVMMVMCLLNHSSSFAGANDCQFQGLSNCAACDPPDRFCEADDGFTNSGFGGVAGAGSGSDYSDYDTEDESGNGTSSSGQSGVGGDACKYTCTQCTTDYELRNSGCVSCSAELNFFDVTQKKCSSCSPDCMTCNREVVSEGKDVYMKSLECNYGKDTKRATHCDKGSGCRDECKNGSGNYWGSYRFGALDYCAPRSLRYASDGVGYMSGGCMTFSPSSSNWDGRATWKTWLCAMSHVDGGISEKNTKCKGKYESLSDMKTKCGSINGHYVFDDDRGIGRCKLAWKNLLKATQKRCVSCESGTPVRNDDGKTICESIDKKNIVTNSIQPMVGRVCNESDKKCTCIEVLDSNVCKQCQGGYKLVDARKLDTIMTMISEDENGSQNPKDEGNNPKNIQSSLNQFLSKTLELSIEKNRCVEDEDIKKLGDKGLAPGCYNTYNLEKGNFDYVMTDKCTCTQDGCHACNTTGEECYVYSGSVCSELENSPTFCKRNPDAELNPGSDNEPPCDVRKSFDKEDSCHRCQYGISKIGLNHFCCQEDEDCHNPYKEVQDQKEYKPIDYDFCSNGVCTQKDSFPGLFPSGQFDPKDKCNTQCKGKLKDNYFDDAKAQCIDTLPSSGIFFEKPSIWNDEVGCVPKITESCFDLYKEMTDVLRSSSYYESGHTPCTDDVEQISTKKCVFLREGLQEIGYLPEETFSSEKDMHCGLCKFGYITDGDGYKCVLCGNTTRLQVSMRVQFELLNDVFKHKDTFHKWYIEYEEDKYKRKIAKNIYNDFDKKKKLAEVCLHNDVIESIESCSEFKTYDDRNRSGIYHLAFICKDPGYNECKSKDGQLIKLKNEPNVLQKASASFIYHDKEWYKCQISK